MAQYERKFGIMTCLAGAKFQVIPRHPNSYDWTPGHSKCTKARGVCWSALAPDPTEPFGSAAAALRIMWSKPWADTRPEDAV